MHSTEKQSKSNLKMQLVECECIMKPYKLWVIYLSQYIKLNQFS